MNSAEKTVKIVVLGDSIAEGLGVKNASYGELLCAELIATGRPASLLNLAHTGYQISDSLKLTEKMIEGNPDIVIISHGITEALIRPKQKAMRFVPRRWRQKGWLDPRPYFSRKPFKRLYQKMESALRWRWKVFLIRVAGGEAWMAQSEFEKNLSELLYIALNKTSAVIILMTPPELDEKFFPGSPQSLQNYRNCLCQTVMTLQETKRVLVCDIANDLEKWGDFFDDHFHPNTKGHAKIAAKLGSFIKWELGQDYASLNRNTNS